MRFPVFLSGRSSLDTHGSLEITSQLSITVFPNPMDVYKWVACQYHFRDVYGIPSHSVFYVAPF